MILRLREAMNYDVGLQAVIDILHADLAIVIKLIRLIHSPLYASVYNSYLFVMTGSLWWLCIIFGGVVNMFPV